MILLVEDDEECAATTSKLLRSHGYRVTAHRTGSAGLAAALSSEPALMLLDLGLPDVAGLEILRRLGRPTPFPVIILSSDCGEAARVSAFRLGAVDYVPKPFFLNELLERIAVRIQPQPIGVTKSDELRRVAGYGWINTELNEIRGPAGAIRVTPKTCALLLRMLADEGKVLDRATLLRDVWGLPERVKTQTLEYHINQARKALNAAGMKPTLVQNIAGRGYRINLSDLPSN